LGLAVCRAQIISTIVSVFPGPGGPQRQRRELFNAKLIQSQVLGAALFGYTKNKQLGGLILNFPTDRTKVLCLPTDVVCDGALLILPAHFLYGADAAILGP
jgi:hypothetical protein